MTRVRLLAALLFVVTAAAACGSSPTLPDAAPSQEASQMESPTLGSSGT